MRINESVTRKAPLSLNNHDHGDLSNYLSDHYGDYGDWPLFSCKNFLLFQEIAYLWNKWFVLNCLQETLQVIWSRTEKPSPEDASYCQTHKTLNTWKISGMLIVYWPITIKFRIPKQTSKPQTNYHCCLRFSYLTQLVYFL